MVRPLLAIATVVLLGAFACGGSGSGQPASTPAASAGTAKVDASTTGSIAGKVAIEGTVPQNPVVHMASDPVCAGANKDGAAAETFVVDGGALENVFVYIKDDLGAKYAFETPATPVKIEQKGCHYVPHVAGIRAGQPLEISNDDSTMHTVHGMGHSNQEFNFSQPLPGIKNTVALTTTEVLMPVKCDVHPWMHAYIGVVNHPFFAVSAGGGKFDLRDVPPGTYTVAAVHEKLGTQSQTVTIGAKENKEITFTFKAAN
jgi:plastocyanin